MSVLIVNLSTVNKEYMKRDKRNLLCKTFDRDSFFVAPIRKKAIFYFIFAV